MHSLYQMLSIFCQHDFDENQMSTSLFTACENFVIIKKHLYETLGNQICLFLWPILYMHVLYNEKHEAHTMQAHSRLQTLQNLWKYKSV